MKPRGPRRGRVAPRSADPKSSPARARRAVRLAPVADAGRELRTALAHLQTEIERLGGHVREAVQKIERLTIAVADLQDDMADLQASLGEGEVEYGPVEEDNSEMGEGHA